VISYWLICFAELKVNWIRSVSRCADVTLGYLGETNPDIDLVVPYKAAKRGDVEFHDCDDRDDVLMAAKCTML
jgi:hypothetical protein